MPKQKVPSPQELYWARKQAQEAYLPPGLINHGNTCFMNSVLQGLIATRLLADLVQFNDISEETQEHSSALLLSQRSPQFTNGHGRGDVYEKPWVDMPIGDRFIDIMYRAWCIQSGRKRESLSPKDLLGAVGRKYDQYLDFAQQDAHEFLRILLDAMRMEEQDVIKLSQPQPPKQPKKRRRSSHPPPAQLSPTQNSSNAPDPSQSPPQPLSEADTLISFSDMIFGGKLTSLLICQKCKHISQTYEDFNDISLSLKPEDYAVVHSRKRDRFKNFAKKLAAFPSTSLVNAAANASSPSAAATNTANSSSNLPNGLARNSRSTTGYASESNAGESSTSNANDGGLNVGGGGQPNGRASVALSIQRSSSVPPSPREREDPQITEKMLPHLVSRRRSMEHLQSDPPSSGLSGPESEPVAVDVSSGPHSRPTDRSDIDGGGGDPGSNCDPTTAAVNVYGDNGGERAEAEHRRSNSSETKETYSDDSKVIINGASIPTLDVAPPPEEKEKHIEFAEPVRDQERSPNGKEKKKRDDDSWTKISRRISLTVKLGRKDKEKDKEKDKDKKDKDKAKDKEVDSGKDKDKKRSRPANTRRFSGIPIKSKQSSPITSATPTPAPDGQTSTSPPISASDDRPIPEQNAQLLSSPLNPSAAIVTSASSPAQILSPPSTTIDPSQPQSQPPPPIVTPTPLRSFSTQSHPTTQATNAHNIPRLGTPLQSFQTHLQAQVQKVSGIQRSKSPKPPKQTKEEEEYLRRILADVAPVPVSMVRTTSGSKSKDKGEKAEKGGKDGGGSDGNNNPLARLKSTTTHLHISRSASGGARSDDALTNSNSSTSIGTWLPLAATSQFSGLEECLRMFTAVEVLGGENMVGCRRCWKIQNGLVKGSNVGDREEDSDDEDHEENEPISPEPAVEGEEKKKRLLASPLQSFNSQSTTSTTTFASAESGELGSNEDVALTTATTTAMTASSSQMPVPFSMSTPTLASSITTFSSETVISTATPLLPQRSNSTPFVEQVDHWPNSTAFVTPQVPSSLASPTPPPKDELHNYRKFKRLSSPPALRTARPLTKTPGGLPIPRISTTPAVESTSLDKFFTGTDMGDVFADKLQEPLKASTDDNEEDEAPTDYGTRTPASNNSSARSSLSLHLDVADESNGGSTTDEDVRELRKRQGMVFRDSLVVPTRMPGRLGTRLRESRTITTGGTDGDGFSEVESIASVTASEESESESIQESVEEDDGDVGRDRPLVPPGLGREGSSSAEDNSSTPQPPDTAATVISTAGPPTPTPPKPVARPKKKKETILRPAFKRYLVSIPPPVLVIHLKRFQHLDSSSSSGLSLLAGKIAAGFSANQSSSSGARGAASGGGFGFNGIGGGGFKKLEEFVSFPEWLDLSPFLAPTKEEVGLSKKSKSHSSKQDVMRRDGTRDKNGRCMYRLYAVVVHIGNMLGGHYVAYVALPDHPPLSEAQIQESENVGEKVKKDRSEKTNSDEGRNSSEKRGVLEGRGATKRQWAYISDTNVRLVSLDEVLNTRAYICMYERV